VTLGLDVYSVAEFAWLYLSLSAHTGTGANPRLCLRTDTTFESRVGVTVELFGHSAGLSKPLLSRHLGTVSVPTSPNCLFA